ncbi:hypothetical protein ACFLT3_02185 [Chloroflexota bacterium]
MNNVDVLLSRLAWPSVLVRERAAVALAALVSRGDSLSKQVKNALMEWIEKQDLESMAAIGIIVFSRLADQNPEHLPTSNELDRTVRKPSLLSFALLKHLYGSSIVPDWSKCHSGTAISTFESPKFFDKYKTNFVPPIYSRWMEDVQDRTMLPMLRQWAYEWVQLVSAGGYKPSERVLDFGMRTHRSHMVVDFPISEAYRSAYLRTLAWALTKNKVAEEAAISLALEACPIDLHLWRVRPGIKPVWWPKPVTSDSIVDTIPVQVWSNLSILWNTRRDVFKDKSLLAAEGRILQDSNALYDISIRSIFQIANGPTTGEPEEIKKACDKAYGSYSSYDNSHFFQGDLDSINPNSISQTSNDWSVLPASLFVRPRIFPRWQYWRGYQGIQLPCPFLASNKVSFYCEPNSIKIFAGDAEIGSWQDWTDGVTEELLDGAGEPHGWTLEISSDLVDEFARKSHSTYSWICALKILHRKHHYESFSEFSTYQLYGTTNLILPR